MDLTPDTLSRALSSTQNPHGLKSFLRRVAFLLEILLCALAVTSLISINSSSAQTSYNSRYSLTTNASKPTKPQKKGSSRTISAKSTVGLDFNFVTLDQNGGVWLSGNALLLRGLLVKDGNRELRAVTIQGIRSASEPQFITPDIGWLTDYRSLYRSIDGGGSWSRIDIDGQPTIRSLYFRDVQNGWAGGWHGEIYRTTDAGQTWQKRATGLDYEIQKLFFINDLHGWANAFICYPNLTRMTALLETTDGGGTWETLSNVDADSPQSVDRVVFVSREEGWGIDGWQNNIVHTLDGGKTWTIQQRRENHGWESLFFISPKEGWASGQDGILHTVDGGKTWESQMEGDAPLAAGCLNQIAFTDRRRGWVVCRDGALRTTDGGATWKPISDDWKWMIPSLETLIRETSNVSKQ